MHSERIFAYVSHAGSREIAVMRLEPQSGDLAMVQRVSVNGKAMPIAVSPDRRFLYAALRSKPYSAASFAIDPESGALKHLGDTPAHDSMNYICTDRSGRFLLAALNPQDMAKSVGELSVSAIAANGVIQAAHQVVTTGRKPHAILPDPANRHVCSASLVGDIIVRHRFDPATGMLGRELPPVHTQTHDAPRHLRFHPNGGWLCVINEDSGTLIAYAYDQGTGALKELRTVSVIPPGFKGKRVLAADLHFTPDGRFLYASARGPLSLTALKVDAGMGMLTPLATYPTLDEPRGFAIDPTGRYLIVAGRKSNSIACYAIDRESGGLTMLKEYRMGQDPNWVEIVTLP